MMSDTKSAKTMTCEVCNIACQRFAKHRNGLQRFRCLQCGKTYTEDHTRTLDTMYISKERASLALPLLLEGNWIRSIERVTKIDKNTIRSGERWCGERV